MALLPCPAGFRILSRCSSLAATALAVPWTRYRSQTAAWPIRPASLNASVEPAENFLRQFEAD
jgi:hypothetical protein